MASPRLRLSKILKFPGVNYETTMVFTALLGRCVDEHNLCTYIVECVDKGLQRINKRYNLQALDDLAGCTCLAASCLLLSVHLVGLAADTLNSEARRWMSDFLLIAIGKRKHQHRMWPSHPLASLQPPDKCHPERRDREDILERHVRLRDGPACSASGSGHSVVCVQLIPFSDDSGKMSRFRELARVFFQAEIPSLNEDRLDSSENALLLSMYWKDRLDKGLLVFVCFDGDFHAVPISRHDSDDLAEERQSNRLQGPTMLELHNGPCADMYPELNPHLAWIHQVITMTWLETGLSDRMIEDIDHVDKMPTHAQSMEVLGQQEFGSLLHHRLMM
ncbi:hypothetical protein M408DRAFT_333394, partial [Serendipita vermifera MAFF 305830]